VGLRDTTIPGVPSKRRIRQSLPVHQPDVAGILAAGLLPTPLCLMVNPEKVYGQGKFWEKWGVRKIRGSAG